MRQYKRGPRPALSESLPQFLDRELAKIESSDGRLDAALTRLKEELVAAGVVTESQITMSND